MLFNYVPVKVEFIMIQSTCFYDKSFLIVIRCHNMKNTTCELGRILINEKGKQIQNIHWIHDWWIVIAGFQFTDEQTGKQSPEGASHDS